MEEKKFHVGVKALIVNADGQILLLQEDVSKHSLPTSEYWDFPGGRMKVGESILDTLAREIEEETGITNFSKPEFFTAVISNHEIKLLDDEVVGIVLMVYRITIPIDCEILISDEQLGYEWVDPKEAAIRLMHKYPQELTNLI